MERPKTTWRAKSIKVDDDAREPRWVACKICGTENLTFATSSEYGEYVCNSCKKEDTSPISMRCLRHKKRFNVPRWWTDVSRWLCPACYDRLSEEERSKYAPKGIEPPTRSAEEGKPIVLPSKNKNEYCQPSIISYPQYEESKELGSPNVSSPESVERADAKDTNHDSDTPPNSSKWKWSRKETKIADNPSFAGLLPRYKIACHKCGEVVPCHYVWFEKSTVLCPSCYGQMNDFEIKKFHEQHKSGKPRYEQDVRPFVSLPKSVLQKVEVPRYNWTRQSQLVNSGGYWSNARIMSASEKELIDAARKGIVSKARMRIELKRRKHTEYFDMLSEEVGVTPIPMF